MPDTYLADARAQASTGYNQMLGFESTMLGCNGMQSSLEVQCLDGRGGRGGTRENVVFGVGPRVMGPVARVGASPSSRSWQQNKELQCTPYTHQWWPLLHHFPWTAHLCGSTVLPSGAARQISIRGSTKQCRLLTRSSGQLAMPHQSQQAGQLTARTSVCQRSIQWALPL